MNRQDKKIYASLMNRIAIALLLNQGVLAMLGTLLTAFSGFFSQNGVCLLYGECAAYFWSFVIPIAVFNKMNKNAPKEIYEPIAYEKMPLMQSIFACFVALGGTLAAAYLNNFLVGFIENYSEFTQSALWEYELESFSQIIAYVAYTVIIPALVEEYLFRWTVCKSLAVYGKPTAIIVSAALFSLMHANIEQTLYTFVAGALFAWIYLETKNIAFPIALHLINNGIASTGDIIASRCGNKASEAYFTCADTAVIALAVISAVCLAFYYKKKGRIIERTVLKPDENGNEVAPLTFKERISGFFSLGTVLYVIYSLVTMLGLIILSKNYG